MPLYEFVCGSCGAEFEELVPVGSLAPCPACASDDVRRRWSPVGRAGSGLELTGKAARQSNAQRGEREARRKAEFSEARRRKRAGE